MGKIKKMFVFVFLINTIFLYSQMRTRLLGNDLVRFEIKGKVKNIFYMEYQPSFKNKKKTKYELILYDFLGSSNYKYSFNKEGYIIAKEEYILEGNKLKTFTQWDYKYINNKISRERCIYMSGLSDTLVWEYSYPRDNLIQLVKYNNSEVSTYYEYIQKEETEIYTLNNSDYTYQEKKLAKYDNENRLVNLINYQDSTNVQDSLSINYIDNNSSQKFSEVFKSIKDNHEYTNFFEYDTFGNIIKIYKKENDKSIILTTFQYQYDGYGNWIEKRSYNNKNILLSVLKREIEYY